MYIQHNTFQQKQNHAGTTTAKPHGHIFVVVLFLFLLWSKNVGENSEILKRM